MLGDLIVGFALHWAVGSAWMASGYLPAPIGWIDDDRNPPEIIVFVVFKGLVWPLVLYRVIRAIVRRESEFEI